MGSLIKADLLRVPRALQFADLISSDHREGTELIATQRITYHAELLEFTFGYYILNRRH